MTEHELNAASGGYFTLGDRSVIRVGYSARKLAGPNATNMSLGSLQKSTSLLRRVIDCGDESQTATSSPRRR